MTDPTSKDGDNLPATTPQEQIDALKVLIVGAGVKVNDDVEFFAGYMGVIYNVPDYNNGHEVMIDVQCGTEKIRVYPREVTSMAAELTDLRKFKASIIEEFINQAIEANPKAIQEYKEGAQNAFSFLLGQAVRFSKGKIDPKMTSEVLQRVLNQ